MAAVMMVGSSEKAREWDEGQYSWDRRLLVARPAAGPEMEVELPTRLESEPRSGTAVLGAEPSPAQPTAPAPAPGARATADLCCLVKGCTSDLSNSKAYYKRFRICEGHMKSLSLSIEGRSCRFCQQCGKFHPVEDFDGANRNCRKALMNRFYKRRNLPLVNVPAKNEPVKDADWHPTSAKVKRAQDASEPRKRGRPRAPRPDIMEDAAYVPHQYAVHNGGGGGNTANTDDGPSGNTNTHSARTSHSNSSTGQQQNNYSSQQATAAPSGAASRRRTLASLEHHHDQDHHHHAPGRSPAFRPPPAANGMHSQGSGNQPAAGSREMSMADVASMLQRTQLGRLEALLSSLPSGCSRPLDLLHAQAAAQQQVLVQGPNGQPMLMTQQELATLQALAAGGGGGTPEPSNNAATMRVADALAGAGLQPDLAVQLALRMAGDCSGGRPGGQLQVQPLMGGGSANGAGNGTLTLNSHSAQELLGGLQGGSCGGRGVPTSAAAAALQLAGLQQLSKQQEQQLRMQGDLGSKESAGHALQAMAAQLGLGLPSLQQQMPRLQQQASGGGAGPSLDMLAQQAVGGEHGNSKMMLQLPQLAALSSLQSLQAQNQAAGTLMLGSGGSGNLSQANASGSSASVMLSNNTSVLLNIADGTITLPASMLLGQASALQAAQTITATSQHEEYEGVDAMERLSIKLHNARPEHLAPDVAQRLRNWLSGMDAATLQGTLRYGCVHLVLDITHRHTPVDLARHLGSPQQLAKAVAQVVGLPAECLDGALPKMQIQVQDKVVSASGGSVQCSWMAELSHGAPDVEGVAPLAIVRGQQASLYLTGTRLANPNTRLHARLNGQRTGAFVHPDVELGSPADSPPTSGAGPRLSQSASAAGGGGGGAAARLLGSVAKRDAPDEDVPVVVYLDEPASCGLLVLEWETDNAVLSDWWPVAVMPDEAMATEVNALVQQQEQRWVKMLLTDLGLVLDHLCDTAEPGSESEEEAGGGHGGMPLAPQALAAAAASMHLGNAFELPRYGDTWSTLSLSSRGSTDSAGSGIRAQLGHMLVRVAGGSGGEAQHVQSPGEAAGSSLADLKGKPYEGSAGSDIELDEEAVGSDGNPIKAADRDTAMAVMRRALRLLPFCCGRGMKHTCELLLRALLGRAAMPFAAVAAVRDTRQLSLMHLAVASGNTELVQLLLQLGTAHGHMWEPLEPSGPHGVTLLQLAVLQPDGGAILRQLLQYIMQQWAALAAVPGPNGAPLRSLEEVAACSVPGRLLPALPTPQGAASPLLPAPQAAVLAPPTPPPTLSQAQGPNTPARTLSAADAAAAAATPAAVPPAVPDTPTSHSGAGTSAAAAPVPRMLNALQNLQALKATRGGVAPVLRAGAAAHGSDAGLEASGEGSALCCTAQCSQISSESAFSGTASGLSYASQLAASVASSESSEQFLATLSEQMEAMGLAEMVRRVCESAAVKSPEGAAMDKQYGPPAAGSSADDASAAAQKPAAAPEDVQQGRKGDGGLVEAAASDGTGLRASAPAAGSGAVAVGGMAALALLAALVVAVWWLGLWGGSRLLGCALGGVLAAVCWVLMRQ